MKKRTTLVLLGLLTFVAIIAMGCPHKSEPEPSPNPFPEDNFNYAITMLSSQSINTILRQKLGAKDSATAFKFTAKAPASSLVEGESKYRLSEKVEGETPCWAWREGNTIYCYAKGFTDRNKKLPLKSAEFLFYYCSTLEEIDLHLFDTSKCTNMSLMFSDCYAVKALDVTGFDTSNVTCMEYMFLRCKELETVDVTGFDTSNNPTMSSMFKGCSNLTKFSSAPSKSFTPIKMDSMFEGCKALKEQANDGTYTFRASWFDTSKCTTMASLFKNCSSFTALHLDNWDVSNVTDMSNMFAFCSNLEGIWDELAIYWDTSKVTNMHGMFGQCKKLDEIAEQVACFNTSNVTDMGEMFFTCSALTELDVSTWDVSKVTTMDSMFFQCGKLKTIFADETTADWRQLTKEKGGKLESSTNMFTDCTSIIGKGANGTNTNGYNESVTDIQGAHLGGWTTVPGYFTKK